MGAVQEATMAFDHDGIMSRRALYLTVLSTAARNADRSACAFGVSSHCLRTTTASFLSSTKTETASPSSSASCLTSASSYSDAGPGRGSSRRPAVLTKTSTTSTLDDFDRFIDSLQDRPNVNELPLEQFCSSSPPQGVVSVVLASNYREEISPYYKRDRRDVNNAAPVDLVGFQKLLHDRYVAACRQPVRKTDQAAVSAIDAQLREQHGVIVYDVPPIWTTILDDPPEWQVRQRERWRIRQLHEQYGPRGHGYRQQGEVDSLVCDLDLPIIHQLLATRTRLRADGDFERADAVKLELSIHGVRVLDETSEWTVTSTPSYSTGTSSSSSSVKQQQQQQRTNLEVLYLYKEDFERSRGFLEDDDRSRPRVEQLVRHRTEALAIGDNRTASFLDLELYRTYRVQMCDGNKTWFVTRVESEDKRFDDTLVQAVQRAQDVSSEREKSLQMNTFALPIVTLSSGIQAQSPSYRQSAASSTSFLPVYQDRVEGLVRDRSLKRDEGRFLEADAIRKELWFTYNVGISDRLRQFSVGGVFGEKK